MRFGNSISWKAALYAVPLFMGGFVDKVVPILFGGAWPTPQMLIGCGIVGIVSMCIGLRAFFDGSYERSKSNGNTQHFTK